MSTRSRQRVSGGSGGSAPSMNTAAPRPANAWSRPLPTNTRMARRPAPKPVPPKVTKSTAPLPPPPPPPAAVTPTTTSSSNITNNQNLQNVLRERFLHLSQNLVGQRITLTQKNGTILEGLFTTFTPFREFDPDKRNKYVISNCKLVKANNGSTIAEGSTVILSTENVSQIWCKSMRIEGAARASSDHSTTLQTDTDISANGGRKSSELVAAGSAWTTPQPPSNHLRGSIGEWDQFRANEQLSGVRVLYDENVYTTRLDKSKMRREEIEKAERIAREIEGTSSSNLHVMEERNQKVQVDYDEEDLYSGVLTDNRLAVAVGDKEKENGVESKPVSVPPDESKVTPSSTDEKDKSEAKQAENPQEQKEVEEVSKEIKPPTITKDVNGADKKIEDKLKPKLDDKPKAPLPKKNYAMVAAAAMQSSPMKYPPGLKIKSIPASVPIKKDGKAEPPPSTTTATIIEEKKVDAVEVVKKDEPPRPQQQSAPKDNINPGTASPAPENKPSDETTSPKNTSPPKKPVPTAVTTASAPATAPSKKIVSKLNPSAKEFTFNPSAASFTPSSMAAAATTVATPSVLPSSSSPMSEGVVNGGAAPPQYMHHPQMQHGMMPMMNHPPPPGRYPYPHPPHPPQHLQLQPSPYDDTTSASNTDQPNPPQQSHPPPSSPFPTPVYYPVSIPPHHHRVMHAHHGHHPAFPPYGPPYRMPIPPPVHHTPVYHGPPVMYEEENYGRRGGGGGGRGGRRRGNGRKNSGRGRGYQRERKEDKDDGEGGERRESLG